MDNWRGNAVRVTKYNPVFRDESDRYIKDEWTSFADIGNDFDGVSFTLKDYQEVEDKYVKAVALFCEEIQSQTFIVTEMEKDTAGIACSAEPDFCNSLIDGYELSGDNIERVIRQILREYVWCVLVAKEDPGAVVRFGYDYYMYFSFDKLSQDFKQKIVQLGLFVD